MNTLNRLDDNNIEIIGDGDRFLDFPEGEWTQGDWTLTRLETGTLQLKHDCCSVSLLWSPESKKPTGIIWYNTELYFLNGEHTNEFPGLTHISTPEDEAKIAGFHDFWRRSIDSLLLKIEPLKEEEIIWE